MFSDCSISALWRLLDLKVADVFLTGCIQNEAAMTPFEIVSLIVAIIMLAGGFAFAGIQIGKSLGEKK